MTISLSRGDNIQEGHFAERSWASIVVPPPLDLPLNVLSDLVNPFVNKVSVTQEYGRLHVHPASQLWNVSFPPE